jgi:putative ABC transport system ATP-binding protein
MTATLPTPVSSPAAPALAARDVSLEVADARSATVALRGITLAAPAGTLTAVIGGAGSGKSTLLHVLAGLDRPTGGSVRLAGRNLSLLDDREATQLRRRHVGLLLPEAPALPTITVRENVALPLLIARQAFAEADVDGLLQRVGLRDRCDRRPGELTAGERRRAALARALLGRPTVLLADEPLSGLAAAEAGALLDLLLGAAHADGVAVLVFTRDEALATAADRVVRLDQGRMVGAA